MDRDPGDESMPAQGLQEFFRRLRRLADPTSAGLGDAELLERYARTADQAAFELLLWRHGPMVHGVCRRLLRRAEDAEDAFQATFLALVRKAASVRRGGCVGAWLYQVAYRVALRARADAITTETTIAETEAAANDDVDWRDLGSVLDEEVRRLPSRYRDPVVLCYLEGRTHVEAARELGCPKGTVAIRLLRARKLLRTRLTRRGVTPVGGIILVRMAPRAPAALVSRTLQAAFGGCVPVRVTTLSEGVIRAMFLNRLKTVAAVLVAVTALVAASSTVVTRAAPADEPNPKVADQPAAAPPRDSKPLIVRVPALRDGQLLVIGSEAAPGETVAADLRHEATVGRLVTPIQVGKTAKPEQTVSVNGVTWKRWQDGDPLETGSVVLIKNKQEYKTLQPGDKVKAGQVVALIDPILASGEVDIKIAALDAAAADLRAAQKTKEEAERRVTAMESSMKRIPGSVSKNDYEGAILTAARYLEEVVAKRAAVNKCRMELIQANAVLGQYEVRSPVSGVIKTIERERGEPVKALDTVMVIECRSDARRSQASSQGTKERLVRAARDGSLLLVGTPAKPGDVVGAEAEVMLPDGTLARGYRRLRPGDTVEVGDLLARVDDAIVKGEIAIRQTQLEKARQDVLLAAKEKEAAERRVTAMEESMARVPGSVSKDDYEGARLAAARCRQDEVSRRATILVREGELRQSLAVLSTYEIRSPVRGVVRELFKSPGEAVHTGEPVLRLTVAPGSQR
jgi:RNA polymerase sigma factor (sigma-70 family)